MIHSLEIEGYRLLSDFKADFGQLNVVIGANATGKSTLIDCLQLISDCSDLPLKGAFDLRGGWGWVLSAGSKPKSIRWRLIIEKPGSGQMWDFLPLEEGKKYAYEASLVSDAYGQPQLSREVLARSEPYENHSEPFKFLEATAHKSHLYDPRQRKLVPFDQALPQQAQTSATLAQASPQQPSPLAFQEPSLRLAQMRFFNEFPYPSWIRVYLSRFTFYPVFDVGRLSKIRTSAPEITPERTLASGGENLGAVLHEMLTRYDYKAHAEELRQFLRVAYPFFEDIFAETAVGAPSPARVNVRIRERELSRSMELWDLSDGMLRFICLATALLGPFPPSFLIIDEPETGLHPKLLPVLADMIKSAAERTQVLVTTHSPDLLNQFRVDDVAVMNREDGNAVWRRPRDRESLVRMLQNVTTYSLGDLLRAGELESLG